MRKHLQAGPERLQPAGGGKNLWIPASAGPQKLTVTLHPELQTLGTLNLKLKGRTALSGVRRVSWLESHGAEGTAIFIALL